MKIKGLTVGLSLLLVFMLALVGCGSSGAVNQQGQEGSGSGGETKMMKLAVVTPKERSLTQGLYKFEEIVERETNGKIQVEVYPDGQLGGDRDVLEGLQLGTIEGTTVSTGPVAAFAPRFNVFDLPFLFKDEQTAYEVLDGPIGQELLEDLTEVGIIGLNYWENGFRHLTNNVREVKTMEDIKGLKIRTLENDLHIDAWTALGALPTPIPYTELYVALQQGVVDGQENPYGNIQTAKFYEVQKYLTNTGHIYNASPFMISKKFWDTLTPEEQEIIRKAADEARDYQRELNRKESEEALQFLKEQGMIITDLPSEERQKILEVMQPIYEKYTDLIGADLVNKVLEAVK